VTQKQNSEGEKMILGHCSGINLSMFRKRSAL